jgi:hypothetical protein
VIKVCLYNVLQWILKSYVNTISGYSKHIKPFLAHLAKGNVSFCHHLASVVR